MARVELASKKLC